MVKSFMDSLPPELEDAARIDGCTDIGVFLRIVIPLSIPAIAAFTLFFAVAHWNTYFNALISSPTRANGRCNCWSKHWSLTQPTGWASGDDRQ